MLKDKDYPISLVELPYFVAETEEVYMLVGSIPTLENPSAWYHSE